MLQDRFLLDRGRGVNPFVKGYAKHLRELGVYLRGIFAGYGSHFTGQKIHDDAVLVRSPDRSVFSQERGACALFSSKAVGPVH